MSEKIYALLLRLYPANFRNRYREESLHLFRDRLRDEPGFFARLRLWFDLLTDTALALPRAHHMAPSAVAVANRGPLAGLPSFDILDRPPLRPAAIVFAAALSLAGTGGFFLVLSYAGVRPGSRLAAMEEHPRPQAHSQSSAATPPTTAPPAAPSAGSAITSNAVAPQAAANANAAQDHPATTPAATESPVARPVDPAELHRVVEGAAQNLRDHYFDPNIAQHAAAALVAQEKLGADNAATPAELAVLLTRQIRSVTEDRHLIVVYSAMPLPSAPLTALSPAALAAWHQDVLRQNCFIEKAAILPHIIGYLQLNAFPDPSICHQQVATALASLNHAGAIIFDLRTNGGGMPDMVAEVAAPLFDHPVPWYNPKANPSDQPLIGSPGSPLANKPVYILTSSITLSGAEQFAYNLQMLHRATVIGATTGGSAHVGAFHRIDDHYGIGIPETRIINPYSDQDWEIVGVTPDIQVKPADALTTAERLAETKLRTSRGPR
ncbi:MAG TPA: S41 family peptidase [Acidobacteriaceae bacterium]|jgi:hypothetical protein|nr:S41 family peptidase [Acidobacteriaceae bacterium]